MSRIRKGVACRGVAGVSGRAQLHARRASAEVSASIVERARARTQLQRKIHTARLPTRKHDLQRTSERQQMPFPPPPINTGRYVRQRARLLSARNQCNRARALLRKRVRYTDEWLQTFAPGVDITGLFCQARQTSQFCQRQTSHFLFLA